MPDPFHKSRGGHHGRTMFHSARVGPDAVCFSPPVPALTDLPLPQFRPLRRWGMLLLLSALTGVIAGLAIAAMEWGLRVGVSNLIGRALPHGPGSVLHFSLAILLLPSLGGLLSALIVLVFAPEARGHGADAMTRAFHRAGGVLGLRGPVFKAFGCVLVISLGGSAGPEGPVVALGAAIGSTFGRLFRVTPAERRTLLIAGCAAGVGAIFRCPLGGALFGVSIPYSEPDLESDAVVTSIRTLHSLGAAEPIEFMLYAETGLQWGPFLATGAEGQGGTKNAYWTADTGELELPAGWYAVADSDPETWSSNAESKYDGFLEVRGFIPGDVTSGNPFASATSKPGQKPASSENALLGLWLSEPLQSGEQMLLNIESDASLELYYAYYHGSGNGDVKSLMDDNWEYLEMTICGYSASDATLALYTGAESENVMSIDLEGTDTMILTDEWGATFILHHASQEQAGSWRSWNWNAG